MRGDGHDEGVHLDDRGPGRARQLATGARLPSNGPTPSVRRGVPSGSPGHTSRACPGLPLKGGEKRGECSRSPFNTWQPHRSSHDTRGHRGAARVATFGVTLGEHPEPTTITGAFGVLGSGSSVPVMSIRERLRDEEFTVARCDQRGTGLWITYEPDVPRRGEEQAPQRRTDRGASPRSETGICSLVARARRGDRGPAPQPSRYPMLTCSVRIR